jgi:hypothetical protein
VFHYSLEYKANGFKSAHIIKDLANSLAPTGTIDRPKIGLGIPRAEWPWTEMKKLVIKTLTDTTARRHGWLNPVQLEMVGCIDISGQDKHNLICPM